MACPLVLLLFTWRILGTDATRDLWLPQGDEHIRVDPMKHASKEHSSPGGTCPSFMKALKWDLTVAVVGCPMKPRSGLLATPLTLRSTITLRRRHGQWSPASGFTSGREFVRRLNFLAASNTPPVPPHELIRTSFCPYFERPSMMALRVQRKIEASNKPAIRGTTDVRELFWGAASTWAGLERYGSSLVDEFACGASKVSVPPQVYWNRLSEVVSGVVIKKFNRPREELVVVTEVDCPVEPDYGTGTIFNPVAAKSVISQKGLNRKHIFDSGKGRSTRLQPEYIDALQYHRFDYTTLIEERPTDASADYAITHSLTPLISMQNHYSLMYREEVREMFPTLKIFGFGSIPWSPLVRELLSRPNAASSKRGDTDPVPILSK
ncbi:hypothetical protein VTO73DRAFT_4858 [Trametes versicolor]